VDISSNVILIVAVVVFVVIVALSIVTRYRVAGPDQAFIVTGRKGKPVKERRDR